HEFGSMELGQKLSHKFVVRNEGEAPLLLKKGEVQCKCTVPTTPDEPIPPGESIEIELTWEPVAATEEFHQMAQIWTNDPKNQQLELHVKGAVERLFALVPGGEWQVNRGSESDAIGFTGLVLSPLVDEFEITDYRAPSGMVTAEFQPLTDEELAEHHAKSGYRVHGTISGKPPIGKFRETFTMKTNVEGQREVAVHVAAFFPGPFSILGKDWIGSEMLLRMGEVKSDQGKSVTLSMFTPRQEQPMQFEIKEATPNFLQMAVERDESFDAPTREKYVITLTVPPGAPQGSWQGEDLAKIRVGTNREDAPEFELYTEMIVR
ncbi:MAG: DUF1573 domain-containing protein, partial [Planctomycetaceae bacterium]|nr:DUF1573 domain-containing protein [Planctomycetaceae bacterium]